MKMTSVPPVIKRRRRLVRPEEMRMWEMFILVAGVMGGVLTIVGFIKMFGFLVAMPSRQVQLLVQLPFMAAVPWWLSRAHSCGVFLALSRLKRITWSEAAFFATLGAFYGEIGQFKVNGAWALPHAHWLAMGPTLMLGAAVEEVWLRGWIYPALRAHWPLAPSLGCMLLLVIATHQQIWHDWTAGVLICGGHLGCTCLRERYQFLTPGLLAHVVINGIAAV